MLSYLKQSTASQTRILGPFVDDTDFKSLETGLTIANTDVKLMKDGATSVNKNSGGGTHRINGDYAFTFDTTDSNTVGELRVSIAVAGALVVVAKFWVLEEAIYDALFGTSAAGFDANQRVDVGSWLGTAVTLSAGAPDVNLQSLDANVITAASIAALALDGKGDWNIDKTGYSLTIAPPTAAAIADAVYEESLEDHVTEGTAGYAQMLTVYAGSKGPGIYIDSNAANTNTVKGFDGTEANPVSTFVAARTLANGIGTDTYYLETGTDLELAATHANWRFFGLGSPSDTLINLGTQDVSMSLFDHVSLEGTQGGASRIIAEDCVLRDPGAGITTLHILGLRCGIIDDITLDTSNDNVLIDSYSLVAGGGAPIIRASGAAGTLIINGHKGGVDLRDLSASHNLTLYVAGGQVIFDVSNNVNATVELRGIGRLTDNTAGMASLNQDAYINMPKINAEADTAISDAALATAAALAIAQTDLDTITGTDGVIIAPAQGPIVFTGVSNEPGITCVGQGTGSGFLVTGGATGHGMAAIGGATSGDGIHSNAVGGGKGMNLVGVGANAGLRTEGGTTGAGIHAHGGATGATPGVEFHSHSASGNALELEVDGTGDPEATLQAILDDTAEIGTAGIGLTNLGGQSTGMKAEVNAEMVDVMDVDTVTLPGQEAPPLTPTRTEMMAWDYKVFRNEKDQSATLWQLKADDGVTVDAKATVSDAAGVATKEEIVSGP